MRPLWWVVGLILLAFGPLPPAVGEGGQGYTIEYHSTYELVCTEGSDGMDCVTLDCLPDCGRLPRFDLPGDEPTWTGYVLTLAAGLGVGVAGWVVTFTYPETFADTVFCSDPCGLGTTFDAGGPKPSGLSVQPLGGPVVATHLHLCLAMAFQEPLDSACTLRD